MGAPPVASGSTDIIKQVNDLMSVVIVEEAQEAEGPTQQDRPPGMYLAFTFLIFCIH